MVSKMWADEGIGPYKVFWKIQQLATMLQYKKRKQRRR